MFERKIKPQSFDFLTETDIEFVPDAHGGQFDTESAQMEQRLLLNSLHRGKRFALLYEQRPDHRATAERADFLVSRYVPTPAILRFQPKSFGEGPLPGKCDTVARVCR